MRLLVFIVLAYRLLHHCSSNAIVTEKYTKKVTSKYNLVAMPHLNTTLLKCTVLCSQHTHSCPRNKEIELRMPGVPGSCPKPVECVGFRFTNDACILFKMPPTSLKKKKKKKKKKKRVNIRQVEMYLTSRFVESEDRKEATKISVSTTVSPDDRTVQTGKKTPTKLAAKFGSRCSKNDQCDYDHGLCLSGKCTCRIGHSFDFNTNTCVTRCKQYGSKFTSYANSGIVGCNNRTNDVVSNKEICIQMCLQEKTFICINAEYLTKLKFMFGLVESGRCNLCDKTWAEVPPKKREAGKVKNSIMMYRHCA